MRIVCLSDTHGFHRKVRVPPGDLLIHAGDFTLFSKSQPEILDFNAWLGELPHRYKIVIPGNHEFAFEETPRLSRVISNAVFVIDEAVEVCWLASINLLPRHEFTAHRSGYSISEFLS